MASAKQSARSLSRRKRKAVGGLSRARANEEEQCFSFSPTKLFLSFPERLLFRCFIVGARQGRLFRSCFLVVRRVFGGVGGQEADLCAETAILCSLVGLNSEAIRVRARDQRAVLRRSRWASLRRTWYRTSHGARNLSRKATKDGATMPALAAVDGRKCGHAQAQFLFRSKA